MQFDLNNYATVQERINRFFEMYPEGSIITELASDEKDWKQARYKATIRKDASQTYADATGYAFEVAGTPGANRFSHEENAETSAIGRALANLGGEFAKDAVNRASREEMSKVARMQDEAPFDQDGYRSPAPQQQQQQRPRPTGPMDPSAPVSEKQLAFIVDMLKAMGLALPSGEPDAAAIASYMQFEFEMENWPDINKGQATTAIDKLKAMRAAGERLG